MLPTLPDPKNARGWIHGKAVIGGVPQFFSASSVDRADRCLRAWHFEKIAGKKPPESKSQGRGTRLHLEVAHYLRTGQKHLGSTAMRGLHFVPDPGPDLLVERDLLLYPWEIALTPKEAKAYADRGEALPANHVVPSIKRPVLALEGVPFLGDLDCAHRRGTNKGAERETYDDEITVNDPPGTVEVLDWKNMGDDRFLKAGSDLVDTIQMASYGEWVWRVASDAPFVRLSHGYFIEKGRSRKATALVDREATRRTWEHAGGVARSIMHAAAEPETDKVDANLNACDDYGGCPHRSYCKASMQKSLAAYVGQTAAARALAQWTTPGQSTSTPLDSIIGAALAAPTVPNTSSPLYQINAQQRPRVQSQILQAQQVSVVDQTTRTSSQQPDAVGSQGALSCSSHDDARFLDVVGSSVGTLPNLSDSFSSSVGRTYRPSPFLEQSSRTPLSDMQSDAGSRQGQHPQPSSRGSISHQESLVSLLKKTAPPAPTFDVKDVVTKIEYLGGATQLGTPVFAGAAAAAVAQAKGFPITAGAALSGTGPLAAYTFAEVAQLPGVLAQLEVEAGKRGVVIPWAAPVAPPAPVAPAPPEPAPTYPSPQYQAAMAAAFPAPTAPATPGVATFGNPPMISPLPPDAPASDPALAAVPIEGYSMPAPAAPAVPVEGFGAPWPQPDVAPASIAQATVESAPLPAALAPAAAPVPAAAPPAAVTEGKAKRGGKKADASVQTLGTSGTSINIYVNCIPGGTFTNLAPWMAECMSGLGSLFEAEDKRFSNDDGTAVDPRLAATKSPVAFGRWRAALGSIVNEAPLAAGNYVLISRDEVTTSSMDALRRKAEASGGVFVQGVS